MKVIVTKLLGSAEVEFLRKGVVVHRERFTGKTNSRYGPVQGLFVVLQVALRREQRTVLRRIPCRQLDREELTMRKRIIVAIQAHAAAQYPKECCGLLLAVGRAQKYFACRNIATEPNEEFRLDPEDYAAAEDLGDVIGIVHSH